MSAGALLAPWVLPARSAGAARAPTGTRLAASWQTPSAHFVGIVRTQGGDWEIESRLALPGRAHGLLPQADGALLVVARRPGDWLLRWVPQTGATDWLWLDEARRFNGHVAGLMDGSRLLSTETDQDSGRGWLGVWSARKLERQAGWPTHGLDPHELLVLPQAVGQFPAGTVLVANGGIPTQAETGRSKMQMERMDSSLVALDPRSGALLGQWRVADPRLSLRHLAWDPLSRQVGMALQAEHDHGPERDAAAVFARWDGSGLQLATGQPALKGYGGSVCAAPAGGFVVSCPRANGLAWFDRAGGYLALHPQAQACPLALHLGQVWAGGGARVAMHDRRRSTALSSRASGASRDWQFDNHWQALARSTSA